MTRNLRTQLASEAERWIRAWSRPNVSREDAAVMVTYWHLYEPTDPELVDEVLSRFSPAEPPAVAGLDFLAVEQDAKTIVAETLAELAFCTNVYVGNEGEFKCDRPAGHGDHHWNLLAEFGWPVEVPKSGGWDDDTSRCARCGTAYSPSWATHCVPCDGPMPVVSGGVEAKPAAPNVLLDATIVALPEPKPGQQYVDFEGDLWQVQSDGTLLWLDTRNINDHQVGLTKSSLLRLAKDWGPLTAGPLVEVQS